MMGDETVEKRRQMRRATFAFNRRNRPKKRPPPTQLVELIISTDPAFSLSND